MVVWELKLFDVWQLTVGILLVLIAVAIFILPYFIGESLASLTGTIAIILLFSVFLSGILVVSIVDAFRLRKEKRKKAAAWKLEDQLKDLKEQLDRGAITQEEYEQKKKKLLEKSET